MPGFFREHNFDYGAIEYVFRINRLSRQKQAFYFEKALAVIDVIQAAREKRRGKSN
jgi:hypothetical protein